MIDTIYIEDSISAHEQTRAILKRFPSAARIPCDRYGEVFNPKAQNFRLQKRNPALILAEKFDHFVLEAPAGYGIGGDRNYYFSHMLNCIYDCRYCFLQGMYRSAHYVLFVNYEDFETAIEKKIEDSRGEAAYFFSGYDCDSLALDSITGFTSRFLPFFERYPSAWMELRTKSVQVKTLLQRQPVENCVVAFSLTPHEISAALEFKTPSVASRLHAMWELGRRGWKLGLRFDPMIYHDDFEAQYSQLFEDVFRRVKIDYLHSVSLGPFRLPKGIYDNIYKLYPDEPLFCGTA